MSFTQDELEINGHAIEVRINAEKLPELRALPRQGAACSTRPAGLACGWIRALYGGYSIPPYYDSLIGKLIVHGRDRPEALARLQRALGELIIDGDRHHGAAVPCAAGRARHPERRLQHPLAGKMAGDAVRLNDRGA